MIAQKMLSDTLSSVCTYNTYYLLYYCTVLNKHLPTTIPAYKITATIKIKCTEILASIKYWFGDIF